MTRMISHGGKVEECNGGNRWKGGKINHKRDTNRLVILCVLSDLVVKIKIHAISKIRCLNNTFTTIRHI